jgi:TonB-linked SusC/RagA family outer membrane protein
MRNYLSFILCLSLCSTPVFAQQKGAVFDMEGIVLDENRESLPGASVFIKDKLGGVMADVDGKFKIKAQKGDIIKVTILGYESLEYYVQKEEKDLRFQLTPSTQAIDEVVVMGMGSKRKISQVASITTVDVAELQVPTTSVANLLGGKVAGVISMMNSGEPGRNISDFWIRGIGTFGYNSGALVLIDGLEGDLNSIDVADIESFSVLKDASATAVYGVRGANGVVIITTKKGVSGKLSITGRAYLKYNRINRLPEYLRAYDYAKLVNEAKLVRGDSPQFDETELYIMQKGLDSDLYPDIDWQDETIRRSSMTQNYYINARGGTEITRYFISLGGDVQSAAYKVDRSSPYASNVGYNKYFYRLNLDIDLTPTTTVYLSSSSNLTIQDSPGVADTRNLWRAQSELTPIIFPLRYSTGDLPSANDGARLSPYVGINYMGRRSTQYYQGNANMSVSQKLDFITEGLDLHVQGAYDLYSDYHDSRLVMPQLMRAQGRNALGDLVLTQVSPESAVSFGNSTDQYRKYFFKSTLNYKNRFGDDHYVNGLVNFEMDDTRRASDAFDANQGLNANLRSIPRRHLSGAGWITYSFRDTYMADLNLGYTGTENFQPGRQFGWFPSIGIGWVPSAYELWKDNIPWFDFLKVKLTYGSVGNDRIASRRFPYLTTVTSGWGSSFGASQSVEVIRDSYQGADNLDWEQSVKTDLGIEIRLFKEKFTLNLDAYNDRRLGIFQERRQVPEYVGLTTLPYGNVGKMRSFGSDGSASYTQEISPDLSLTVRGNYTYWNNFVENWEQIYPKYSYQEYNGFSSDVVRGLRAVGLFKDEEDVLYSPAQSWSTVLPGDIKYMDVNGDGVINDDDQVPLSLNTTPHLMYGLGGDVRYKQLTMSFLFKGTGKTDYYVVGGDNSSGYGWVPFRDGEMGNVLTVANDPHNRWIPRDYAIANGIDPSLAENPNAQFPRLSFGNNANNNRLSDFWRRNGQYVRLQEVSFNYNLKGGLLKKIGLSSIDLQLVGENLYIWSKSKMFDPEQAKYNGREYPVPSAYTFVIYVYL